MIQLFVGHSSRAFYWMFWLTRSKFVMLLKHLVHFPRARYFIPYCTLVAWSRVAKGRHFVLDVLWGGMLGAMRSL
jgi:membrane-associated phospholipid phosphatase